MNLSVHVILYSWFSSSLHVLFMHISPCASALIISVVPALSFQEPVSKTPKAKAWAKSKRPLWEGHGEWFMVIDDSWWWKMVSDQWLPMIGETWSMEKYGKVQMKKVGNQWVFMWLSRSMAHQYQNPWLNMPTTLGDSYLVMGNRLSAPIRWISAMGSPQSCHQKSRGEFLWVNNCGE